MKLSAAEEVLMHYLWSRERAFMKDLLEAYPAPKPAPTTVATLLKRMSTKGLIGYREVGSSREYYPLIARQAYFTTHVEGLIKNFFNNSKAQFASFFTSQANLTTQELEALQQIIQAQLEQRKP